MKVGYYRRTIDSKEKRLWPGEQPKLPNWPKLKAKFLKRLRVLESKSRKSYYKGHSTCRICKEHNGSAEYTSRGYTWPGGYAHYVEAHNECPPMKFWVYVTKAVADEKTLYEKVLLNTTETQ